MASGTVSYSPRQNSKKLKGGTCEVNLKNHFVLQERDSSTRNIFKEKTVIPLVFLLLFAIPCLIGRYY